MTLSEEDIVRRIAAAEIRLRHDKVVRELTGDLEDALSAGVPDGQAILFTCTAPIRLSGKTAKALMESVREGFSGAETLFGNRILVRRVTGLPTGRPRVLGFVHNPDSDAVRILDIAEKALR